MGRRQVFALGLSIGTVLGSLAYPAGRVLGQVFFNHSVIYPHTKEN